MAETSGSAHPDYPRVAVEQGGGVIDRVAKMALPFGDL
jgi:hypothetical protein